LRLPPGAPDTPAAGHRTRRGDRTEEGRASLLARAWEAFRLPLYAGIVIEVIGTLGSPDLGRSASWLDCLYMTWITV